MSNVVIKAENLSKQYRLGEVGTGTIQHDLKRWWYKVRGKEDPFLKIGETNDRTQKGESEFVWALKDINFEIEQGDVVGIIGRNGAGKSTLLKILSKTTLPTTGCIKAKGRIASLLEVGTGFHPELTGRDNIFLNGAILGMTRREIKAKFDEIVDFAGVERYVDTPVKRYSSGMYVRLAFAVAAFLEPDILVVDEVLAVGDAEFQKKAVGKMKDVSTSEGRTVLFVSHNMAAVASLTDKAFYMKNGHITHQGPTEEIISLYYQDNDNILSNLSRYANSNPDHNKPIELMETYVQVDQSSAEIYVAYEVRRDIGSVVAIKITNSKELPVITLRDNDNDPLVFSKTPGKYQIRFSIPLDAIVPDVYRITVSFSDMKSERFDFHPELLTFVINHSVNGFDLSVAREGILLPHKHYIGDTEVIIT